LFELAPRWDPVALIRPRGRSVPPRYHESRQEVSGKCADPVERSAVGEDPTPSPS
jgi:hypothetical protein